MTFRFIPALVAVTCLAAACSSSSDSASTTTTTAPPSESTEPPDTTVPETPETTNAPETTAPPTATPPTTTPETTAPTVDGSEFSDAEIADRELARTALVTLDDFPDGWWEEPQDDDEDDPETKAFEAQFDSCLGRDDDERVGDDLEDLAVTTGDFHPADDDSTSVAHEVVLAVDEATAITAMAEVAIDGAEPCLADVIQAFYVATFAEDPELAAIGIGEVVVTRTETEREPDLAVGVLLEIPLTIGDETISQFLEILYQRQGRALSELSFSSFSAPFTRDGYTALSDEAVIGLATIGS